MLTQVKDAIRRTRQHHAIEHATLLLLAERFPGRRMVGYSDPSGFTVLCNLPEEAVRRALTDAMLRLQAGERQLAIHPNCGTNLAATALLVTLAVMAGSAGRQRDAMSRFTGGLVFALPMLLAGPALGMRLQRYTTLADVSDRWVTTVRLQELGSTTAFRIEFE